jgi:hypothetical protein
VLLACSADGGDKLPPPATEKCKFHIVSRISRDYQQNTKLIQILRSSPKYFNITSQLDTKLQNLAFH